jgi:UDP-glucose 4-epimerase
MILLTGASGFIGKYLLELLLEKYGHDYVVAFTSHSIKNVLCVLHNNYSFNDDIFIQQGFEKIETIIHAGSFIPKINIEVDKINFSNSNIYNTEILLGAKLPYLKKIIFLSTVDIYNSESVITENTSENPVSMYAHSKLYTEKMLQKWGEQHGKIVQLLRIGHVYGPREEKYAKLIPETFRKVLTNQNLTIWGTGEELRSFIYVEDVVKAIENAIDYNENLGVINIAGSQYISIVQLVEKIKELTNSEVNIERIQSNFKGRNLIFDNSKMMRFLLKNETNLDEGLLAEYTYMKQLKD